MIKIETNADRGKLAQAITDKYYDEEEVKAHKVEMQKDKDGEEFEPYEGPDGKDWLNTQRLALDGINKLMISRRMILRKNPFFSTIMMSMDFHLTHEDYIAKTNGKVIVFNPLIVAATLTQSECNALVLHELLHNILMHSFRRGTADGNAWNIAADLVVNHTIENFFSDNTEMFTGYGAHRNRDSRDRVKNMPIKLPENALLTSGAMNKLEALRGSNGLKGIEDETGEGEVIDINREFEAKLEGFGQMMGEIAAKSTSKGTMIGGPSTNRVYKDFQELMALIKVKSSKEPPGDGGDDEPGDGGEGKGEGKGGIVAGESHGYGDETADYERVMTLYKTMGEVEDFSSNKSMNERQTQITATLVQKAAMMAKTQGQRHDDAAHMLAKTIESEFVPEIPWNQQFRNIVMDITRKEDYTWRRPNKKWMQRDIYMPTIQGPKDEKSIAIGIDVSGSVGQHMMDRMSEELSASLSDIAFKAHVAMCDTEVKKIMELSNEDLPFKIDVKAGGGTHLSPIFDTITEKDWKPILTIMFTDMEFNWAALRERYYELGGEQHLGQVVFLNFGRPVAKNEDHIYGYQYRNHELDQQFYSTIVNMQRKEDFFDEEEKRQAQQSHLVAEPITTGGGYSKLFKESGTGGPF